MTTFDIRLFGAIEIRRDGILLTDFRSQKALVLLAYLICANRPITRDYLAGLAWPEMEQSQALGLLRRSLHDLNSQLPGCLEIERRTVGFSPSAPATIDIHTFAHLLARHDGDKGDIAAVAAAAALYDAPFLHGVYVDEAAELESWLAREQEQWQQAVTRVLQRLIQHHTAEAAYAPALRYAQQLLALEPWREEVQRQAMLLLARTGQTSAALTQYERCRQILYEELAVEPAPETDQLYARIQAIGRTSLPSLPAATTPFVGRAEELVDLTRLLANPSGRLITLLGPGGIGKTRLALEVARSVVGDQQRVFLHGVRLVALAGTDTTAQFVSAVAQALAFTVQPQSPPEDQLCYYLRDKELLLVLDNFEQLIDSASAAFVTKLLQMAPDVKLLITSRVRLNLQCEQLYWMQGLHFPASLANREELQLTNLLKYSSLQLFIETAQRVQPAYRLAPADALAIVAICQLVQGMPLAIELAAAWASVLAPAKIVTEMNHTLDFLSSEMPDLPLRQRSLRAVFDTSWRLLTPTEQAIFQQLSVFRGGFTLEAAQAVAGATLPLLAHLQQHSFIQYQPSHERYTIHELLRQYGAERLAQNESLTERTHVRYGSFFCRWLAQLGTEMKTRQQESALRTAAIENENLHTAWLWAIRYQLLDLVDAALDGLFRFDEWQGHYAEGEWLCQQAIAHLPSAGRPFIVQLRAKLLTWQGIFARYQGEPERADQLLHASLALLDELQRAGQDVRAAQAFLKLRMGKLVERMDRLKAVAYFEQSLALCQVVGDAWGSAHALQALGFMAFEGENLADATPYFTKSLDIFQRLGDARGSLGALNQLVISFTFENKLAEAIGCADEAERIASQIAELPLIAQTLACKGMVTYYLGKIEDVYAYFLRSLALYEELGDRHTLPNAHLLLSETLLHLGRINECQIHIQKATALVQRSGDTFYRGWALLMAGMASVFTKEYAQAEKQLTESIESFSQSGQSRRISESWSILAIVAVETNDLPRARYFLYNALRQLRGEHYLPPVLFALETTVVYLCHQAALIEATEISALMSRYNLLKSSIWAEVVIRQPLHLATASLPPAAIASAQARGRTFDLWTTAMRLLEQFSSAKLVTVILMASTLLPPLNPLSCL